MISSHTSLGMCTKQIVVDDIYAVENDKKYYLQKSLSTYIEFK